MHNHILYYKTKYNMNVQSICISNRNVHSSFIHSIIKTQNFKIYFHNKENKNLNFQIKPLTCKRHIAQFCKQRTRPQNQPTSPKKKSRSRKKEMNFTIQDPIRSDRDLTREIPTSGKRKQGLRRAVAGARGAPRGRAAQGFGKVPIEGGSDDVSSEPEAHQQQNCPDEARVQSCRSSSRHFVFSLPPRVQIGVEQRENKKERKKTALKL